jgi:monofunctional biosynthetic peptidoglycan transglycosylase
MFGAVIKVITRLALAFSAVSVLLVVSLRWINPPTSAVIIAWELHNGRVAKHQWQALERISPQLQMAVIAAEDQKFPNHNGFDLDSIRKALSENRSRVRGASTISQQVAKNLFLWHGRSYFRKAVEAWFTILLELFWSKQRILEMYLNIAEFGEGVYGAQAAAQIYFGRPAHTLSERQAALLAAVLPNPKTMSAARPSAYVNSRAATISRMVRQLGGTGYLRKLTSS